MIVEVGAQNVMLNVFWHNQGSVVFRAHYFHVDCEFVQFAELFGTMNLSVFVVTESFGVVGFLHLFSAAMADFQRSDNSAVVARADREFVSYTICNTTHFESTTDLVSAV